VTTPFPLPVDAEVSVIQLSFTTAAQSHPASVVTVMLPSPPMAGKDWLAGAIVVEHEAVEVSLITVAE
jgi:hypothetical protein